MTGVSEFAVGDRVVVTAPHAEYTLEKVDYAGDFRVFHLHPDLSLEHGTFHPLATSSAGWTRAAGITEPEDRVVVLGQGIVGNLVMQFARRYRPAQLIAVDALDLRLRIAQEVGASEVVNAGEEDPVAAVQRLTDGGATIVMDCVGGRAGLRSFVQAQDMVADGGLIQLIGLYHEEPLDLDASKIMGKRLIGSYPPSTSRAEIGQEAMAALVAGEVRVEPLITHPFRGPASEGGLRSAARAHGSGARRAAHLVVAFYGRRSDQDTHKGCPGCPLQVRRPHAEIPAFAGMTTIARVATGVSRSFE